ncbi:MAG: L-threonine 3-dehydrogenase [Bacteriovoracaceae bacterium]
MHKFQIVEWIFSAKSGFRQSQGIIEFDPDSNKVLIEPLYVAICGSDLHLLENYQGQQLRIGHEWIGRVIECGDLVKKFKKGDMVTSGALLGCGQCQACRSESPQECAKFYALGSDFDGALKTKMVIAETFLIKIHNENSKFEILQEILSIPYNAFELSKSDLEENRGKNFLVIGAGSIGLSIAHELKRRGFEFTLIEQIPTRIKRASKLGFKCLNLAEALINDEYKARFDVVIDASGDHLNGLGALKLMNHFGKFGFFGMCFAKYNRNGSIDYQKYSEKMPKLKFYRGCKTGYFRESVKIWSNKLKDLYLNLITHEFNFDEVPKAFDVAKDRNLSGKVVIKIK